MIKSGEYGQKISRKSFGMRRIIVIITLFSVVGVVNVRALKSNVLYFIQYPVSEIEGLYNGQIIDEDKGTCSFPIDILSCDGFILLEDSITTRSVVYSLLDGNSGCNLDRINIVTPKDIEFPFTEDLPLDVIKRSQAVINGMTTFSPYFLSKDREYLYRFLQFNATVKEVVSPPEQGKIPKVDVEKDNMSYPKGKCYYISDIQSINPYVDLLQTSIWYPFKSYFDKSSCDENFRALYVLKFDFSQLKGFYDMNLSEGRIPTFNNIMTLPHKGMLIETASYKDVDKAVKSLLHGDGVKSTRGEDFLFPYIHNRKSHKKLPLFYNIGPCENLGIKYFRAINTRTIIEADLALAPYMISEDGLSAYKIIYIEGTSEIYNQHLKKNFCYIVNLPFYSDKDKIEIISGLTYSTPYVLFDSERFWVPDMSSLSFIP